jgi:hypothetical protein
MTLAREGSIALRLSRFATEVAPLFVATGATAHWSRTTLGPAPTWLLVGFGAAWLLTAASAVWHLRRGSYVPWSSCRARPFQTFCLLALNAAPWLPLEHLRAQSTTWLALLPAGLPSWICGLAVTLVFVMMAWPLRRTCGVYGRPAVSP